MIGKSGNESNGSACFATRKFRAIGQYRNFAAINLFTNWIRTLANSAQFCQNPQELRQLCCPKFDPAGLSADFAGSENSCRAGSSHETVQVILQEGQK
nr:hypothetical protein [uncultured Agrobacterium sp.]